MARSRSLTRTMIPSDAAQAHFNTRVSSEDVLPSLAGTPTLMASIVVGAGGTKEMGPPYPKIQRFGMDA